MNVGGYRLTKHIYRLKRYLFIGSIMQIVCIVTLWKARNSESKHNIFSSNEGILHCFELIIITMFVEEPEAQHQSQGIGY